jgi:hypothetical protein
VVAGEPVRLVLESDGTQVEDGEYFRTLPNNTILLLLRQGERWYPSGVDVIRAGKRRAPLQLHVKCLFEVCVAFVCSATVTDVAFVGNCPQHSSSDETRS